MLLLNGGGDLHHKGNTNRCSILVVAFDWHCYGNTYCMLSIHVVHYIDVIMTTMASQINSLKVVCSIVYLDSDQRNIKAPRHWPLCGEFTGDRWIPRTNGQLRGKCLHLMTSSWGTIGAHCMSDIRIKTYLQKRMWHISIKYQMKQGFDSLERKHMTDKPIFFMVWIFVCQ